MDLLNDHIFWIGIVATVILVSAYIPLTIKLLRTRQTFGISYAFTVFILAATIIFMLYGILFFVQMDKEASQEAAIAGAIPILVSNIILTGLGIVNIFIKITNQKMAKKNNMTEKQYCDMLHDKKYGKSIGGTK